jgi:hypothetical protein
MMRVLTISKSRIKFPELGALRAILIRSIGNSETAAAATHHCFHYAERAALRLMVSQSRCRAFAPADSSA